MEVAVNVTVTEIIQKVCFFYLKKNLKYIFIINYRTILLENYFIRLCRPPLRSKFSIHYLILFYRILNSVTFKPNEIVYLI